MGYKYGPPGLSNIGTSGGGAPWSNADAGSDLYALNIDEASINTPPHFIKKVSELIKDCRYVVGSNDIGMY